jgi:hypothetical protein
VSADVPHEPRRPRPRRRRPGRGRWVALAAGAVIVFGLGAALGAALESNPAGGGSRTFVHTYPPLRPAPTPRTVTVTATP